MMTRTFPKISLAALMFPLALTSALADVGHGPDIGSAGDPAEADRTIGIEAQDVAFDRERIRVEEGETVRIVVENTGDLLHEFTIGTPEMQEAHQREMLKMTEKGLIGATSMNGAMPHKDPNSVMLEPGERKEIVWTFDTDAVLEFGCNLPGHYEAGMKGKFVIDDA